ncbi:hypothetical protein WH96_05190 [Kiloniella spongiae]|uniref:Uncharacterized protein n=1 Tax=Kiloniella spongiae TaxID=1489064 RepID=A0A0H2MGJ9_9PROT|nr:hypothetical protein [Kiloniella spongiae]KLN61714.1 hypothetical protein WH96_05190 [Kiloniella spongiae]
MLTSDNLIANIDAQRRENGFRTLAETMELTGNGNTILDPFSTLISVHAKIGRGNTFYPNIVIRANSPEAVVIGNENTVYAQSYIEASGGTITIGSNNQFGPEGGVTVKANTPDSAIRIGDHGRYLGGVTILGKSSLGNGAQILGSITFESSSLEAGGSFTEQNPDLRAAVVKGRGLIRNQDIQQGHVAVLGEVSPPVNTPVNILPQSHFHPKKTYNAGENHA